ncbi:MAG: chloride channel protein [Bdellovibrio bacteriovorus]
MRSERILWLRLTLLGLLGGALAAALVLVFASLLILGQGLLLPSGIPGDYETLPPLWRILLPAGAGLLLGLAFDRLRPEHRQVGVVHVLTRLRTPGRERLPARNLIVQLFGASVAIIAGNSVDREGPSVHIGAAAANLAGRGLASSPEEDYTLAACGAAAAIAALFVTPLAGVVFVLEVLKVRYEVARILPVIVAAVTGAVASRLAARDLGLFAATPLSLQATWELPYLLLLGLSTGLVAALFIGLCEWVAERARLLPNALTFPLAGVCTGLLALATPQVMGISQDTLELLLEGQLELGLALVLVFTKLLASGISVGLRVPGGLIGPTLFIGGALGSAFGLLLGEVAELDVSSPGFYATIGMVAMMGATLRAPLAALTALLELTGNPSIILPGMLAVASAELTNRLFLGKESVFESLLRIQLRTPRSHGTA